MGKAIALMAFGSFLLPTSLLKTSFFVRACRKLIKMKQIYPLCIFLLFFAVCSSLFSQTNTPMTLYMNGEVERFKIEQGAVFDAVEVCGLEPYEEYNYWIQGTKSVFLATEACFILPVDVEITTAADCWISVVKRNQTPTAAGRMAGIDADNSLVAEELVSNILISGDCYDIQNIQGIGSGEGIGYFSDGLETIGFEEGIILATGNILYAEGPNESNSQSLIFPGIQTDNDLGFMATNAVEDASGIEFDFTPTSDMIEFEYVFASEEYCEYVNSTYNDVFGFFISGPGINGEFQFNGENIARIPNNGDVVAINSVNHLSNIEYFIGNHTNCGESLHPNTIEYDGFTTPLKAYASVIPCETYHIRMVVGDVGDSVYDSAVFLKANSFQASGSALVEANSTNSNSNVVYESCDDAEFVFTRMEGDDGSEDLEIDITVLNTSTADEGTDYMLLPTSILIPAGQMSFTLPVEIINDNIVEGEETLQIEVPSSCTCSQNIVEMIIQDVEPIAATPQNITVCGTESTALTISPTGGVGVYQYTWDNGATTPTINIPAFGMGMQSYTVMIIDDCGNTTQVTNTVTAIAPPEAMISGSGSHCQEDTETLIDLVVTFTGAAPWEFTYLLNGVVQETITTMDNPHILQVNDLGTYTLGMVSYADGYCEGTTSGTAAITATTPPTAMMQGEGELCAGTRQNTLSFPIEFTGEAPWVFTYRRDGITQSTVTTYDNPHLLEVDTIGFYQLESITYPNGYCVGTYNGNISISEKTINMESEVVDAECADTNTGSISLTGLNGVEPYFFDWTNHDMNGGNPQNLYTGIYNVTMTDAEGCQVFNSFVINQPPRIISEVVKLDGMCEGDLGEIMFDATIGGTPSYLYSIDGGDSFSTENHFKELSGGEYNIMVQDANGCHWADKMTIIDPPTLELFTEPVVTIELGDSHDVMVLPNFPEEDIEVITWSDSLTLNCTDCLNPEASPHRTTPYTITVTTVNGCIETTSLVVQVDRSKTPVYAPNVFSPNNDGFNDKFTLFAKNSAVSSIDELSIYSRWGDNVYTTTDLQMNESGGGWDGTYQGQSVNNGVFVWYAHITYIDGTKEVLNGDVTVMR